MNTDEKCFFLDIYRTVFGYLCGVVMITIVSHTFHGFITNT